MKLLPIILATAVSVAGMTAAQAETSRMDKIKSTGELTLGYRDSSIPFSYLDDNQKPVGYSMDICYGIADALKKDLNLPNLKIKLVSVTSSTRIPLVANGTVDLACGSATNNEQRQVQVSFAPTTFVTATRFAALKSSKLNDLADFKGKTVVSTSGTSNLKWLTQTNADDKLGMRIIPAKDHSEAFLTVASGRASAFFMDDILLAGLVANSQNAGDWMISKKAYTIEPYGIIEPKGDTQFKALVDEVLAGLYRSGEIHAIYRRWFESPLPSQGLNLKLPMSAAFRRFIANPTDSPDPERYR